MAHVAEYKKKTVENIVKLVKEYPIVGAVNMENLPAPQLQAMRAQLRGKVVLVMTKRRIMKIALEKVKNDKKGIEQLEEHLKGMPALIFTKESPFKLSRILQKNKSSAPAKAGQTAPKDITVNKGSTGFAPGPIIGELGMIGIKTGVEGGKVAIKEDTVVVKEGEQIKPKVAEILTRLGIEPMEVGLDLMAAYENGLIYKKDILAIDDQEYMNKIETAAKNAFNLAFNITYTTKDNISLFIGKAFNDAKALGLSQEILDEGVMEELLAKAERSMLNLKDTAKIEVQEKTPIEKAEEKKEEEKKVEEKPKTEVKKEATEEKKKGEPKKEPLKKEEVKRGIKEEEKIVEEPPKVEKEVEVKKPEIKEPEVKQEIKIEEKPKEPIKETIPKEEPKPKEIPKPEPVKEEKTEEPEIKKIEKPRIDEKDDFDRKIEEMVKRTKEFVEGKKVTAHDIVREIEKEKQEQKEDTKEEKKEEIKEDKKEEVPSADELAKKKKEKEQEEIEDLAKELVKKGTLRK